MCGIAGAVVSNNNGVDPTRLQAMSNALAHRGPDGFGEWISPSGQVGLTHRRLSIIDLSPAGSQPMVSPSGRYTITYNGEIYNFTTLRSEFERQGITFRGHSDTEILLVAMERWGVVATLAKIDGMFAFAVWDEQEQLLTLVRDRIGIKPLFYSSEGGELIFASELKPLVVWRGKLPPISAQGLTEFMRLGYVPSPISIFEGIKKLPPGTYACYRHGKLSVPQAYWNFIDAAKAGLANAFSSEQEALSALESTLRKSIASHMMSDVALGAFLSGGIDSSTVTALMQSQSARPVKTFSIGFHESHYNEAPHAAAVAKHLGTDHTELYISDADAQNVIPMLPNIYDEPFADVSQISTFLVSQLAKQHVTVALSGDGGDELFAGYNRYIFVSRFWKQLHYFPLSLRKFAASAITKINSDNWDRLFAKLPLSLQVATPGQKMYKIASVLASPSLLALHSQLVSQWVNPQQALTPRFRSQQTLLQQQLADVNSWPEAAQQMAWDTQTYMVDDILTKVDRASMRVGLEARVPLLDHHVVELAWQIPLSMKLRDGNGKWLLRQLLYQYVPKELVERPKMGFGVPIDNWLRGSLRTWADDYFAENRMRAEDHFDVHTITQTWVQHCNSATNRGGQLWTVLMFQLWWERVQQWV